jgi:histidinol phosphatase-like PHP family hydrolase
VTDHSHGLNIAGGMSMQEAAQQRHEIDRINASAGGRFRLLQGSSPASAPKARLISAPTEDARFEVVQAAPHSIVRTTHAQTRRLVTASRNSAVQILAHP